MGDDDGSGLEVSWAQHEWNAGHLADDTSSGETWRAAYAKGHADALASVVWRLPRRFDPDDRDTWPEDETRVLVVTSGRYELADFHRRVSWLCDPNSPNWWVERISEWVTARPGDLWLPLPPTREAT